MKTKTWLVSPYGKKPDSQLRHPGDVVLTNKIRASLVEAGFSASDDPLESIETMAFELQSLRTILRERSRF